jgi:hypothetical protein
LTQLIISNNPISIEKQFFMVDESIAFCFLSYHRFITTVNLGRVQ